MTIPPATLGRVIAFLVLVACFVLYLVGHLPSLQALLFAGLALAILLP